MLLRVATRFLAAIFYMLIRIGVCWWEQTNEVTETEVREQWSRNFRKHD